jgi:hypothetical protein
MRTLVVYEALYGEAGRAEVWGSSLAGALVPGP